MSTFLEERDIKSLEALSKYVSTLPQYCFEFFIGIENNTSLLTRVNYAQDLCVFFDYLANNVFYKHQKQITLNDLGTLSSKDIEFFLSYLSYYTYKGKTYKNTQKGKARKLASVRSFFKYNYKCDNLKTNVASKVDTPKLHTKTIVRLEVDEVVKLINEAENPIHLTKTQQAFNKHTKVRDVAMLTLFLATGIRVSECVGLNIQDIDMDNNAFKITRKGGNTVTLYFSDEVKTALSEWLVQRESILENIKENALFISIQKRRISVRAVENIVNKYSKIASPLKKISPHKLRSTYGTNLYRETGDIYVVAEVLGHKDVNTTKKHYAAMSDDIKRQASNKVKLR